MGSTRRFSWKKGARKTNYPGIVVIEDVHIYLCYSVFQIGNTWAMKIRFGFSEKTSVKPSN